MPVPILTGPKAEERLLANVLVTLDIAYRMPDHPSLVQQYIWKDLDLFPELPVSTKFLEFWQRSLDGPLMHVKRAVHPLVRPSEIQRVDGVFRLH